MVQPPESTPPAAVRVMVVDDSAAVKRLIVEALSQDPQIEVVAQASDGSLALAQLGMHDVDVVTMDVEMPILDGIRAVHAMRATGHHQPVIMFSTLTERGAQATLEALAAGATDFITKPSQVNNVGDAIAQVRATLVPRIRALSPSRLGLHHDAAIQAAPVHASISEPLPVQRQSPAATPADTAASATPLTTPSAPADTHEPSPRPPVPMIAPKTVSKPAPATTAPATTAPTSQPTIDTPPAQRRGSAGTITHQAGSTGPALVVGSSTGGPEALLTFLAELGHCPVPVLVVQHMPPVFTTQFAARLNQRLDLHVLESAGGEPLSPNTVYLAPGDRHMFVQHGPNGIRTALNQAEPENYCRPAVDVLFRSAAQVFGRQTMAVVLTGMGSDGRLGAADILASGGRVLAQDRESSVVWGMPGAIAQAGMAEELGPPAALGRLAARWAASATTGALR